MDASWRTISFQLKDGFNRNNLQALIRNKAIYDRTYLGTLMLKVLSPAIDVIALANEIYESGIVEYCHPDFIAEIVKCEDPLYPQQYFLNNTGQFGGLIDIGIDASQAWDISTGSDQIIVAVIDDGVEAHDDLENASGNSRILSGCTPGKSGGGTGIPEHSDDGHGEAVTGILTASHNDIYTRGVAPNVKILPVNIFWTGTTNQDVADGINWAWHNDADVLSNSWGYLGGPTIYHDVVKFAIDSARTYGRNGLGTVVVFAAGNNNPTDQYGYGPAGYISFPASVECVVCVSATDRNGNISGYSSFGNRIDLTALGGGSDNPEDETEADIRTLDRMGSNGYNSNNYMNDFNGTSAACPQVSAIAALMLSVNSELTEPEVKDLLFPNAIDIGAAGKDNLFGHGLVNTLRSVAKAYVAEHPDYEYYEDQLPITKIYSNRKITFLSGPLPELAAGQYYCDVYKSEETTNKQFDSTPQGWYFGIEGYSGANPNNAELWVSKNVTATSSTFMTFYYYIKSNTAGQTINKWAPANPYSAQGRWYSLLGEEYTPPPLSVYISGPTSLGYNELGYFTANPSGGSGAYTNYRWWSRDDDGFIPEKTSFDEDGSGKDGNTIRRPPPNVWIEMTQWEGEQTISKSSPVDFSLKCEVTDSDNNTTTDIHSVNVGGFLSKAQSEKAEIAVLAVPENVELTGNYPNPFNPSTSIKFGLPEDSHVKLKIYSITGQKIISLADGSYLRGYHEIKWDGKNQAGNYVSNGIYIYELRTGYHRLVKKMVFAK